jgi:hypothetical protein
MPTISLKKVLVVILIVFVWSHWHQIVAFFDDAMGPLWAAGPWGKYVLVVCSLALIAFYWLKK